MKTKILPIITTIILTLIPMTSKTNAATIIVNSTADSGPGSLRDALASTADGDAIDVTDVSGTILLTSGELFVTNSVAILGPGATNLAVNGNFPNATNRVFHIGPNTTVGISSLTVINGRADFSTSPGVIGGGILNDHATLTVSNCFVTGNVAEYYGGGVYNDGVAGSATLQIYNSAIWGNMASVSGGGIYNIGVAGNATLAIANSSINSNSARVYGGGIYNVGLTGSAILMLSASMLIRNSTLVNGSGGGGIYNDHATLTVSDCTILSNVTAWGGGILNDGQNSGSAMAEVTNSTLSGNRAGIGGGIVNWGQVMLLIANTTLSDNSARGPFSFCGGIFGGDVEIGNTILKAASGANIVGARVTSLGYNLSSEDGGGFLTATGDQINTDPMLGPLQDNGGPTLTHALLPGSPAINAGDPNYVTRPDFDQRGTGFPRVVCGRIDIGAIEAPDTTPPVITCPANIVSNATSPTGAVVTFPTTSASDNCSVASVSCSPASGSTFAIGTTAVTCQAIDGSANTNTCAFTVYVKGAGQQISDLIALVQSMAIDTATKNSLSVKLQAALGALNINDKATACSKLQDFINLCNAQKGKKLTASQAKQLTNEAVRIRAVLGC